MCIIIYYIKNAISKKKIRPILYTIGGFFEKRCLIRYNTERRAASIASAVYYYINITIYCTATVAGRKKKLSFRKQK